MKDFSFNKSFIMSLVTSLVVSLLPTIQLYSANVHEVPFYEIIPFIVFSIIFGTCCYLVIALLCKLLKISYYKGGILTAIILMIFFNAGTLYYKGNYLLLLLGSLAITIIFALVIYGFMSDDVAKTTLNVTAFVFSSLLVVNFITGLVNLYFLERKPNDENWLKSYDQMIDPYLNIQSVNKENLPNIYVFVADEYAGFNQLNNIYKYDNLEFKNKMESLGFNTNVNCINYFKQTPQSLLNLFNLEIDRYEGRSNTEIINNLKNARMFKILKDIGYTTQSVMVYNMVNFDINALGDKGDSVFVTDEGKSFSGILFSRTLAGPFIKFSSNRDMVLKDVDYVSDYLIKENKSKYKRMFTFAYVCCPHAPFRYNENGLDKELIKKTKANWEDKSIYLNQLKYVSKRIAEISESIIKDDPNSVILVMSDHGVRERLNWGMKNEEILNTLNMLYFKGQKVEGYEGLCLVNSMRFILNKAIGFNLPLLDEQEYHKKYPMPN